MVNCDLKILYGKLQKLWIRFKLNATQNSLVNGSPCSAAPVQLRLQGTCLSSTTDCLCSSYSYFSLQWPQYARAAMLVIQMQNRIKLCINWEGKVLNESRRKKHLVELLRFLLGTTLLPRRMWTRVEKLFLVLLSCLKSHKLVSAFDTCLVEMKRDWTLFSKLGKIMYMRISIFLWLEYPKSQEMYILI